MYDSRPITEFRQISPCPPTDQACLDATANEFYQKLMVGIPAVGIEPHEPTRHPLIVGNLATLKYTFYNATISHMDECKISDLKFNRDTLKTQFKMSCPKVVIETDYETSGQLLVVPVHGKGDAKIVTGRYNFVFNCEGKMVDRHYSIRSCSFAVDAVEKINFDINNLFDGNQQLSKAFHDFLHDNWKDSHDFVKDPVWNVHTKKMITAANKLLKTATLR
ncbi:circadian clock-controlled protein daywake-like [Aricia agestis]|uniref:circadian clock-controlled protein daywake-like n=1 Tax=Aricia agestis TaxID=91739 RepID=UPI001C206FA3|nr:circadian clock-controlled protein daywake-like [Aricia agestis]